MFIKETPTLLGDFCVISCMKRLWVIFFVVPIIAQVDGVPLKLTKGTQIVKVNPGDEVVVRLYKENILNLKIYPNRNLKSSIYKTINFEEGFFMTNNTKFLFSEIYSIAPVSRGNMAIKNGIRGFKTGAFGCSSVALLGGLVNDIKPLNPLALGVMVGISSSIVLFLEGFIKGYFYPNISKEYIISKNKWIIKPQQ